MVKRWFVDPKIVGSNPTFRPSSSKINTRHYDFWCLPAKSYVRFLSFFYTLCFPLTLECSLVFFFLDPIFLQLHV